jgi:hypothetical protein
MMPSLTKEVFVRAHSSTADQRSDNPLSKVHMYYDLLRSSDSNSHKKLLLMQMIRTMHRHYIPPNDIGLSEYILEEMCIVLGFSYQRFAEFCEERREPHFAVH